ncbi:MAG: hypothetical protein QF738_08280 [Rhodospirillales bacterium]|jgi:hypothetical protein|nr:hypothetical protein [Rhodospirillales bacterium]
MSTKRFEVVLYNQMVRDRVEQGRHHRFLDDSWADLHHEEFEAEDENDARGKAERRFPKNVGYVIVDVVKIEG